MNPTRLLAASAAIGLWATAASAADLRPEDAVRHIGTASGFVRWYHRKCQTTITGYERWCALGLRCRGLHF
jgi:hypothetical protein